MHNNDFVSEVKICFEFQICQKIQTDRKNSYQSNSYVKFPQRKGQCHKGRPETYDGYTLYNKYVLFNL